MAFKMAKKVVTNESTVMATPDHVSTDLAGKTAILSLKNRTYYTLDDISSPIWDFIQQERRFSEIHQAITARYMVDSAQAERDLLEFLQTLADQNLIVIK
ncbi:hypothetical protein IAD21_05207 [Abditibacteriota bacterium]|nr:hypothetical protein IAD21_05207 [Abditibacteriota bacterium]